MKPVMQTKRGGLNAPPEERGDCLQASIASILEVPVTDVDVPWNDEHWWDTVQRAVRGHGYVMVVADATIWPDTYWLADVPSLNLVDESGAPLPHMIVMHDGVVSHDPALAKRYAVGTPRDQITINGAYVLVPLAIRSLAA